MVLIIINIRWYLYLRDPWSLIYLTVSDYDDDLATEGNNQYDAGDVFYDIGTDLCPNQYESGDVSNPCLCNYINYMNDVDNICDTVDKVFNNDPDDPEYNVDPNSDDFNTS